MLNHYKSILLISILTILSFVWSSTALGDPRAQAFNASYDEDFDRIDYSVAGGGAGQLYSVTAAATGCVSVAAPADLTGPDDADNVSVTCNDANGTGEVVLKIYKGAVSPANLVASFRFQFTCDGDCNITLTSSGVIPTLTEWGLIIFSIMLLGLMVYYIVKRRRTQPVAI
jgi:hypothetical protein